MSSCCDNLAALGDRELLERWQLGTSAAMALLFVRHNHRLVGWAVQATHDAELAKDVAQETWRWLLTWPGVLRGTDLFGLLATHARYVVLQTTSVRRAAHAAEPDLALEGLLPDGSYREEIPRAVHMRERGRPACGAPATENNTTSDPERCTCARPQCRNERDAKRAWRAELARRGMLPPGLSDPRERLGS